MSSPSPSKLSRRILVVATAVACGATFTGLAPANAAQPPPAQSARPATLAGLVFGADGWVTFTHATDGISMKHATTLTVQGTKRSGGGCSFHETGATKAGSEGVYSTETAINPSTCAERVVRVPMARAPGASANVAAATTTTTAYTKTSYIDPFQITITSLAANLSWQHSGSSVPSASYNIYPYEFRYDGWSNTGTPHPGFSFTSGAVSIRASETFRNNDFEELMIALATLTLGPAGAAYVIAACGFSVATAVFNLSEYIKGNSSGGFNWSYNDSTSGGCSDLVSHHHYSGFGTSH
jgi:hypothetical protein